MVKICLLNAAQNATERQLLFAYQSGHREREREKEGGKWDGWLLGMRDMFGDKAAAYATYKWVIVGHFALRRAVNRSMGQQRKAVSER